MNLLRDAYERLPLRAAEHVVRELRLPAYMVDQITTADPHSVRFRVYGTETVWYGLDGMRFIEPGRVMSVRLSEFELFDLQDKVSELWRNHHLYGDGLPRAEYLAEMLRPKFAGLFLAERLRTIFQAKS